VAGPLLIFYRFNALGDVRLMTPQQD